MGGNFLLLTKYILQEKCSSFTNRGVILPSTLDFNFFQNWGGTKQMEGILESPLRASLNVVQVLQSTSQFQYYAKYLVDIKQLTNS